METQKNILKKIKLTRLCKDLTQKDVAKLLNISTPTYSRFESGSTKLNFDLLRKISELFDIESFDDYEKTQLVNIVEEATENYQTTTDADSIKQKIETIIQLLEKQQQLNNEILNKLRAIV